MNQIIEKCNEYKINLFIALINYNKTFDSLKHDSIISALKNQGLAKNLFYIIQEMYADLKARIVTNVEGQCVDIKRGVR